MMSSLDELNLTVTKQVQYILLLVALVLLNACSILPFSESTSDNKSIIKNVDLYEQETVQSDISLLREEINSFKPSVIKLMELESELRELIDVVNSAGVQDFLLPIENQDLAKFSDELLGNSISDESVSLQAPRLALSDSVADDKFSNVKVKPAPTLSSELYTDNVQNSISQISKAQNFRQVQGDSAQRPAQTNDNKMHDKFSSQGAKVQNECHFIANGEGFALHIASYKNKANAEKTLQRVLGEINDVEACNRKAMIAEVTVKEQDYYSARIGAYSTKEEAKAACNQVRPLTNYCAVTQNIGVAL